MISAPGTGSGLDVNSIVSQLVAAQGNNRTLLLADKISIAEAEISAFGSLKGSLESFQSSINRLKDPNTFSSRSVSSSDTDVFTVSGSGNLAIADYDIEVLEFAEAHKLISSGYASQDAAVGTGELTISVGSNSFIINITSENNSLAGIREAINEASNNTGVTASIANVDDGSGGTETKLILSADNTGSANSISVVVDDDDGVDTDGTGLSAFYYDPDDATTPEQLTELSAAVDASITIDGQAVTNATNEITGALEGITINILKKDPGNTHKLSVVSDKAAVESSINTFLASYNALNGIIKALSNVNPGNEDVGLLVGDRTILTLERQFRRELGNTIQNNGNVNNLVELGITTSASGELEIDKETLNNVLDTDLENIANLFSSGNGIASRLDQLVKDYVKSDGIIDSKTDGLDKTVERANDDLISLNESLAKLEDRLLAQFSAMDQIISRLNSTSSFLETQLAALTTSFTQSNN